MKTTMNNTAELAVLVKKPHYASLYNIAYQAYWSK